MQRRLLLLQACARLVPTEFDTHRSMLSLRLLTGFPLLVDCVGLAAVRCATRPADTDIGPLKQRRIWVNSVS